MDALQRARRGDAAAWDALLSGMAEQLLTYLELRLGRLRDRIDACDAVQETLLMAHRSFAQFRGETMPSFRAWLYAIADHRLGELARHHGAQKRAGEALPMSGIVERLRASRTGPATACERADERLRLFEAVDGLAPAEREAVMLHHFHGLTQDEVAARLELTTKQVRGLLNRARYRLGRMLEAT